MSALAVSDNASNIVRFVFFFSSRRRHTRFDCDWSSDVCSSDLAPKLAAGQDPTAKPAYAIAPALVDGADATLYEVTENRSEERRVGKECRSRWSPYH